MRVVALISGGKDSCYNMMQCVASGHEIVALANLQPKEKDELDSFMYQTVGHTGVPYIAQAMELPLFRKLTDGLSKQRGKFYEPTLNDEVEDLYQLLSSVKEQIDFDAVAVGAILSDYQRVRVENVCSRLNLVSLCYLWRRDQHELLQEMIDCDVKAVIIKVAALGLDPARHLGRTLVEMQQHLHLSSERYGLNVCGEGGEFETFTLDCPLFKRRINIDESETVIHSNDPIAPVGYMNLTKLSLVDKTMNKTCNVKNSLDFINDLNLSSYSDLSDPDLSESELELIEKQQCAIDRDKLLSKNDLLGLNKKHVKSGLDNLISNEESCEFKNVDTCDVSTDCSGMFSPSASLQTVSTNTELMETDSQSKNNKIDIETQTCKHETVETTTSEAQTTEIYDVVDASRNEISDSLTLKNNDTQTDGTALEKPNLKLSTIPPLMEIPIIDMTLHNTTSPKLPGQEDKFFPNNDSKLLRTPSEKKRANELLLQDLDKWEISHEKNTINVEPKLIFDEESGWGFLSALYGYADNAEEAMELLVEKALELMQSSGLGPSDLSTVNLYVRDLAEFSTINRVYSKLLPKLNPPSRACVEMPLPDRCHIVMEIVFYKCPNGGAHNGGDYEVPEKSTIHVQSISHWAPANIGPYSQASRGADVVQLAGQIGLVPGSMKLVDTIRHQCKLALRHVARVALAAGCTEQVRDVVQAICFVAHPALIRESRRQLERLSNSALVLYCAGSGPLPRGASVEWSVWAHRHNKQFQYEETGCSIGDLSVAITSRWNYEGTVCACICHLSTACNFGPDSSSITPTTPSGGDYSRGVSESWTNVEQLLETLLYTCNKLSRCSDSKTDKSNDSFEDNDTENIGNSSNNSSTKKRTLSLKVFYRTDSGVNVEDLVIACERLEKELEQNILYTILPASYLQNASTFISICGLRFD